MLYMSDDIVPGDTPPEGAPAAVPESAPSAESAAQTNVQPEESVANTPATAEQASAVPVAVPEQSAVQSAPVESVPAVAQPLPAPAVPAPAPAPVVPMPSAPHFGHYSIKEAQDMAHAAFRDAFEHKAEKILAFVREHGSINRVQAERLLYVSPNTAYLYLKRMVKEGKLRREGKSRAVRYVASL